MNQGLNYVKQRETLRTKILGGCHKEDSPRNIQILESRRRGGELCKVKKRSLGEENRDQKLKLR